MRHARQSNRPSGRPRVGIIADCSNTYGRAILRGVLGYANIQRRWLIFKDLENVVARASDLPPLDGAIFAGVSADLFELGRRRYKHVVHCSGGGVPAVCPVVALDDVMAGQHAAEHLLNCRFDRFAFYGFAAGYLTAENRLAGFKGVLQARGFECELCPLDRPSPRQRMSHTHRPALVRWLRQLPKPIGVMAFDDTTAHDLAEACLEADISVPDHVAIIGVNNDELLCESAWPPLSSVEADYRRVGFAAAAVMDRMLSGVVLTADERLSLLPPLGVIQRQSTNTLAIQDDNLADAICYIREHACDPCTVGDVLRRIPVGRRWLERQFQTQLGRTPHEEIARVRMGIARGLLLRSQLDILEISSRCGFAQLNTFYTAFRKSFGTTPAAYRRQAHFR